ncbi:MAG: alpha/beta hydrolase [Candidatus Eisenbacteria bacterium]
MMHGSPALLAHARVPGFEPGLVFIHGLGSYGRCFRHAPDDARLRGRAMLFPDLAGFGESPAPDGFAFTMEEQADAVSALARSAGLARIAIVGHSMGGAIGVLLAERWKGEVTHFVSAVGNLIPEDCFMSRRMIEKDEAAYEASGFEALKRALRPGGPEALGPASTYYESLERTTARAMWRSAADLVHLSDEGDLLGRFLALRSARLYLYDNEHPIPAHLSRALAGGGVDVLCIPDSGHGLMEDNPDAFYGAVAEFLARDS